MPDNITDSNNLGSLGASFVNASQQFAVKALSGAVESFTSNASGAISGALKNMVSGSMKPKDAIRGGIDSLLSKSVTDAFGGIEQTGGGSWQSSKYAADFAESWAPKNKFLFKVKFNFNDPFQMDSTATEFFYAVKQVDKPKVTYDYDEVNMYNYRTKVLRMMHYDPLTITFHDDVGNKVLNFFDYYRRCMSPLANSMAYTKDDSTLLEYGGMNFDDFTEGAPKNGGYTAGTGFLPNNQKNILKSIELVQIFAHGADYNKFTFVNPKITNFDFDDLDHDVSDGNSMTASFEYDGLVVSYANSSDFKGLPATYPGDNMQPGSAPKGLSHRPNSGSPFGQKPTYLLSASSPSSGGIPGVKFGGGGGGVGGFLTGIGKSLVQAGGAYMANKASASISKAVMGSSLGKKFQNTAGSASGALGGLASNVIGSGVNVLTKGLFGG
jgi:hypothetical protein